jgi:protein tyrosine/serine phosphatase
MLNFKEKNKLVFYFTDQPKVEFSISNNTTKLRRDIIGSEIVDLEPCVLHINKNNPENRTLLNSLSTVLPEYLNQTKNETYINGLINRFLYEFESCSSNHAKSDGYRFYFFYNCALQALFQLEAINNESCNFNFLPKQLTSKILKDEKDQKEIYSLAGSIFLPDGNNKKRKLLDRFYLTIDQLIDKSRLSQIREFCETVYASHSIWNFRDLNENIPAIKAGIVYRSALLANYQFSGELDSLLETRNIQTIIDLRAGQELDNISYENRIQTKVDYIHAPLDPWNQPEWFQENYQQGTNSEIAYRYFIMCCQDSIIQSLNEIRKSKGAAIIHCHAGKDRTGILCAIIALICGASTKEIYQDYLASENDTESKFLKIALDYIAEKGGVINYLVESGMTEQTINQLKNKLTNV